MRIIKVILIIVSAAFSVSCLAAVIAVQQLGEWMRHNKY